MKLISRSLQITLGTAFLILLVSSSDLLAAGGGGHHYVPEWSELIGPIGLRLFNFSLFIFVLWFLLRKPIGSYLVSRREDIKRVIDKSSEEKAWAESMFAEYKKKLDDIQSEIDSIKSSLKEEGQAESERMIAHAKHLSDTIIKDASLVAQAELDELRDELRNQAVRTAAESAREIIVKTISDQDRERIAQDFLGKLKNEKELN